MPWAIYTAAPHKIAAALNDTKVKDIKADSGSGNRFLNACDTGNARKHSAGYFPGLSRRTALQGHPACSGIKDWTFVRFFRDEKFDSDSVTDIAPGIHPMFRKRRKTPFSVPLFPPDAFPHAVSAGFFRCRFACPPHSRQTHLPCFPARFCRILSRKIAFRPDAPIHRLSLSCAAQDKTNEANPPHFQRFFRMKKRLFTRHFHCHETVTRNRLDDRERNGKQAL